MASRVVQIGILQVLNRGDGLSKEKQGLEASQQTGGLQRGDQSLGL